MIIRPSHGSDHAALIGIWATAVDATHDFLTERDRREIETQVRDYLRAAAVIVAAGSDDRPIGFIHAEDGHVHALFVHADHHGRGVGRRLIAHVAGTGGALSVDVNEQNARGITFYDRLGFRQTGRSPRDSDGRPYPILHLERRAPHR